MLMPSPHLAPQIANALPQFVNVCSHLAPPLSVLLCAAPLPTIRQVAQTQDVGSLPLLPYTCMAANGAMWATYGILQHQAAIWVPNGIGLLLALYYCAEFIKVAPKEASPTLPGSVNQHVGLLGAMGVAIAATVASGHVNADLIGQAAVVLCIALFASPLASLQTVLQTKSAHSIPLPFTLASLAACFAWCVTGFCQLHDLNVIIPNTLGLVFGLAQVSLKLKYGNGNQQAQESSPFEDQQQQQQVSEQQYALTTP